MRPMKVGYYKHHEGSGNFGDELGPVVAEAMLGRPIEATHRNSEPVLFTVGSVCHNLFPGCHIWGSGILKYELRTADFTVHAVRGPRTEAFLRGVARTIPDQIAWGDPALLLPDFYQPELRSDLSGKTGFVPHWTWWDKYWSQAEELEIFYNIHLINPTDSWQSVVDQIASCHRIISSSLHGLIVADAYGIPNLWLNTELQGHIPELKFADYFESISRPMNSVSELEAAAEAETDCYWSEGAQALDLQPLRDAFPHYLFNKEA